MTPPPGNSETKQSKTMKLCTVIVYYIVGINKELKFLNFRYSIVCIHCSIVCSTTKGVTKWSNFQVFGRKMKFTWLIALSTRIP